MTWLRTEEEVDAIIEEMLNKSNGKYITQGVAFNKSSESQMKLLKMVLMSSYSFGGMIKELIAEKFTIENNVKSVIIKDIQNNFKDEKFENEDFKEFKTIENNTTKNLGNFL